MVVLNLKLATKGSSGFIRPHFSESYENYLARITHLHLQGRDIHKLGYMGPLSKLTTLYLYDNAITAIENLDTATNLTRLDLQSNCIKRIQNLGPLINLKYLFLGKNSISVVEGLSTLTKLEELDVEKQHLPSGQSIVFEPKSLLAIKNSLKVLNTNNNGMCEACQFAVLTNLQSLDISYNAIQDVLQLATVIHVMRDLRSLKVKGNPFAVRFREKEILIGSAHSLEVMDGKVIHPLTRTNLSNYVVSLIKKRGISGYSYDGDETVSQAYVEEKMGKDDQDQSPVVLGDAEEYNKEPELTCIMESREGGFGEGVPSTAGMATKDTSSSDAQSKSGKKTHSSDESCHDDKESVYLYYDDLEYAMPADESYTPGQSSVPPNSPAKSPVLSASFVSEESQQVSQEYDGDEDGMLVRLYPRDPMIDVTEWAHPDLCTMRNTYNPTPPNSPAGSSRTVSVAPSRCHLSSPGTSSK